MINHPHLHTCLRRREHVLSTRIASPCFTRLRFQLRLSSRDPPDSTKRDRSTRSNWSRLASITMYSTLQVHQCNLAMVSRVCLLDVPCLQQRKSSSDRELLCKSLRPTAIMCLHTTLRAAELSLLGSKRSIQLLHLTMQQAFANMTCVSTNVRLSPVVLFSSEQITGPVRVHMHLQRRFW